MLNRGIHFISLLLALSVAAAGFTWTPVYAAGGPSITYMPCPSVLGALTEGFYCPHAGSMPPIGAAGGKLTVRLVGDDLIMNGKGLLRNHQFYVKARHDRFDVWTRLALVTTDQHGNFHGRYFLPKSLRKSYSLPVCLKDAADDWVYCTSARRTGL